MEINGVSNTPVMKSQANTENTAAVSEKAVETSQKQESTPDETKNKLNEDELIKMVEDANEKVQFHNTELQFSIHEKTKDVVVKVIDSKTDEVIKEIPSEKMLDMVANMLEMAGILVDEKA